jgi:hypothetical protein
MELFRLLGTIAIDNTEANNALSDTSQRASESANETESAFSKIGGVAKTIAVGIGTAGLAIGGAFIGAVESTREYRAEMGLLESAFLTAGHSSNEAKQTYSDLNAVLGDSGQAVEASQHLAKIADNEKELSNLTGILTGVYATFGESLPLEGLAEGINHSASLGEVQGSLADALEWSGITVEDFNDKLAKLKTEEERQDLIVKTLNDTYSAASTQYKETNADVIESRKAQERLSDAMAKVGEVGEPIMTAVKNAIASMAEKAVPVIENLIQKFSDMSQWVKDNETKVHAWVAVILGATTAIAAFVLIMSWGKIMTAAANAIKVVRTAMLAMNAAMLANPIGLVVAAIAGLVAAFIYLWNNCESFRKFWQKTWNLIKDAAQKAWSAIKKAFSGIGSWFSDKFKQVQKAGQYAMNKVKKYFSDAWNNVKSAWNGAKSFFSTVKSWVTKPFSSAKDSVVQTFGKIYSSIKDKINSAKDTVKSAIDKIKGFFKFKWSLPKLKLPSIGIKGKFGIDPPSVPKFSLKWNAEGGILTQPTIFGLTGNTFLGGGEAGHEAIAPIDVLQEYVRNAVKEQNGEIVQTIISQNRILMGFLKQYIPQNVYLDSGALVGELSPVIDARLGKIYSKTNRQSTR